MDELRMRQHHLYFIGALLQRSTVFADPMSTPVQRAQALGKFAMAAEVTLEAIFREAGVDQPPKRKRKEDEEVQVHKGCGGIVRNIGEDGISYCEDCEHVCEGETEYITEEEYEKRES